MRDIAPAAYPSRSALIERSILGATTAARLGSVTSQRIEISDYRPEWPEEFRWIGAALRRELGEVAVRIDHIGSTAVPGLAAKDVIDVQVTVEKLDHPEIRPAFERVGARWTDITTDHVPPGASSDPAEFRKWVFVFEPPSRRANVHVREVERFNQRYALLCRDYLRAHPSTADAYAEVKRQLARRFPNDMGAYTDVKDPVVDLFMSAAGAWTGWEPGPSDA